MPFFFYVRDYLDTTNIYALPVIFNRKSYVIASRSIKLIEDYII